MAVYAQPGSRPPGALSLLASWAAALGQAEAASAADRPDRHRQSRSQILVTAPDSPIMAPCHAASGFAATDDRPLKGGSPGPSDKVSDNDVTGYGRHSTTYPDTGSL